MIVANITTYLGQCPDAIHYYCEYNNWIGTPDIYSPIGRCGATELKRKIKFQSDASKLNRKDGCTSWHIGSSTNRWDTIEDIHQELKTLFPFEDLITYYEGKIFKEMLYILNGEDKGKDFFGEVFIDCPNSCWSNLIPPHDKIIVKCNSCGTIHKFEDVVEEKEWGGKKLIQFFRKREVDEPCCDDYELVWNVIL
jgi:hypothetical protein